MSKEVSLSSNPLFPIFLKLKQKKVLVVGGGLIALQKLQGLVDTEAELFVIAPSIMPELRALEGVFPNKRKIEFIEREYQLGDESGFFMVIAATDLPELNNSISLRCQDQMILVNSVDEPDYCDFYVPSIAAAGDIKVAISTNGKAPAIAQRLRLDLEPLISGVYLRVLEQVQSFREAVKSKIQGDQFARRARLIRWFTERTFKKLLQKKTCNIHCKKEELNV